MNCIDVKVTGSTCEFLSSKESVDRIDDSDSAVEGSGSTVRAATVLSSTGRVRLGDRGVRLDPGMHLGTGIEGEDVGVKCVGVDPGGGASLRTEARVYEVDTEELSSSFSVKGRL